MEHRETPNTKSLNPKGSLPKMDRRTTTNQTSAKATMRFDETGSSSLGDMATFSQEKPMTLVLGSSPTTKTVYNITG